MVELVKARAEFWATYPDSDRHPQAVVRLRRALSAVDFTYLFTHYYSLNFGVPPDGHGQQRQNLYQVLLGTPPEENVIHESARNQFDAWISAVYNRLNGGLGDILNIQSRLPQALDETEVIYERYRAARDIAELQGPAAAAEQRKRREEMQAEEAVQEEARAAASVRQNVCISDDLTTEWRNPPAGGKMEALKRLLIQSLRERANTPGYDQRVGSRWILVIIPHGIQVHQLSNLYPRYLVGVAAPPDIAKSWHLLPKEFRKLCAKTGDSRYRAAAWRLLYIRDWVLDVCRPLPHAGLHTMNPGLNED